MMRCTTSLLLAFMVAAAAQTAVAQVPRVEMTLADALSRAEASPDLLIARAAQAVAERSIAVIQKPQSPTLTTSTHSVTARLGLSLAAPVRWGGQRSAALDVVRAERDAAAAAAGAAANRAREEVTAAWLRLAADEELEKLALARVERLGRTADAVKDLFDAGRVPRVDVVKTKAEVATAQADVFLASAERRAASSALAFLVGAVPTADIVATGERPMPASVAGLSTFLAKATTSAEFQAAEARGRAAAARVTKAKREGLPALTFEGGADFQDPTQEGTDKHVSLGLTIPIGSHAVVSVSKAEMDRDAAERSRLLKSVESETVSTWNRLEAARQRFEALERSTIPATLEAAELGRVAYREGRLDLLRLLESERALLDVQASRIEAWLTWGTQWASLERLVGGIP